MFTHALTESMRSLLFPTTSHLKAMSLERRKDQLSLTMNKANIYIYLSIQLPSFVGNERTPLWEAYLGEDLLDYDMYAL